MEIVKEPKKVTIDPELKNAIQTLVEEESQVLIHLHLHFSNFSTIRIWKSTFLMPHNNGEKINLVHADNISFYPDWTICRTGETVCPDRYAGFSDNRDLCCLHARRGSLHVLVSNLGGNAAARCRRTE
jgi:hypothetical protein